MTKSHSNSNLSKIPKVEPKEEKKEEPKIVLNESTIIKYYSSIVSCFGIKVYANSAEKPPVDINLMKEKIKKLPSQTTSNVSKTNFESKSKAENNVENAIDSLYIKIEKLKNDAALLESYQKNGEKKIKILLNEAASIQAQQMLVPGNFKELYDKALPENENDKTNSQPSAESTKP